MADVIGLSDVSSPDTGKGSKLKTGNLKRSYAVAGKNKCKNWKKLGYANLAGCLHDNPPKKEGLGKKLSKKERRKMMGTGGL
jgi:hypothetical protein